ncbi:hypothetical protein AB7Z98_00505 [Providencia manganoxydans]|uniref:phage tail protein n=1 Tax=Providencia manganoxydans TaxID=2923283 RepID=UPI0034E5DB80
MEIEKLLTTLGFEVEQVAQLKGVVTALGTAAASIAETISKVKRNLKGFGLTIDNFKAVLSTLAMAVDFVANRFMGFIDSTVKGVKNLAQQKDLLFDISEKELQQADEYQVATQKTALSIDAIKAKIALGLLPNLTAVIDDFNAWLSVNKELIAEGLTQVVKWGSKAILMIRNTVSAISQLIENTIGWKAAILGIVAVLAIFKKSMLMAFVANPVMWVVAAIAGLMVLIGDFMAYLNGGESLFAGFWAPAVEWIKSVLAWWNTFYTENKALLDAMAAAWSLMFEGVTMIFGGFFKYISNAFKLLVGLFSGNTTMMSEAWKGMTDGLIQIWEGLKQYFIGFVASFGVMWNMMVQVITNVWNIIKTSALALFDWLIDAVKSVVDNVLKIFLAITHYILAPFENAFALINALFAIFTDDSTSWTEKLGLIFYAIASYLIKPFEAGWQYIKEIFNISNTDIDKFIDDIANTFNSVTELIKKPFDIAFKWVNEKFGWVISGVTSGLQKLGILSEDKQGENSLLNISNATGELIAQNLANPNLSNVTTSNNKNIIVNQGSVNVEQNVMSSDPYQAASLAINGINDNLTQVLYRSLQSAHSN